MGDDQQLADVLGEFARILATDYSLDSALEHLLRRVTEVLPVSAAGLIVLTAGATDRESFASNERAVLFQQLQTELGAGPGLLAYYSAGPVASPDLAVESRFATFATRSHDAGLRSVFAFPLRHGDQPLGALELYREHAGDLTPLELTTAQTMADVTAAYLRNARARVDPQSSVESGTTPVHDALTGLPNRVLLLDRLAHALLRSRRSGKTSAVFLIDLARSSEAAGRPPQRVVDAVTRAAAKRFADLLRREDTLARLSDDVFVILCEDLDAPAQAAAIGTRVEAALVRPFEVSDVTVSLNANVGIAFADRASDTAEQVLRDADDALRQAKTSGGSRQQIFDPRHQHPAEEQEDRQAELSRELPDAVSRGQLHTEYQPIVATADGRITGFEALVRWVHPTYGAVPPNTLIPLAEQSGLMGEIGKWVLTQAWTDRSRWQGRGRAEELTMSVNVSAIELMSPDFTATVAAVLDATVTAPRLLTLEIPESVFVSDNARALAVISELKDMGVLLALDDWTTSYSSLSYLKRFPVDVVKIDRAFVANLGQDPASHIIVGAVVQLAHSLGMTVVAQGVETAEQQDEVAALGCDSCQGYYLARPMTAVDVDTLLGGPRGGSYPRLPDRAPVIAAL